MAPTLHPFLQHQLELYELLQQLHQQQPELALHWRAPGPGLLKRHLANLPRLRWVPEADCHLLVAPAQELLSNPPQIPRPLLLSDPFPVNPQALTALLLLGYRSPASSRLLEPLHREITPNAGLRILVLTNLYPPRSWAAMAARSLISQITCACWATTCRCSAVTPLSRWRHKPRPTGRPGPAASGKL
ncbi:hypothetical protein AAF134_01405 [Synechococcus lacustris Tous-12m]